MPAREPERPRLIMPPDSSDGYLSAASGLRPTNSIFSIASSSKSRGESFKCSRIGICTFCLTVRAGKQRALLEHHAETPLDLGPLLERDLIEIAAEDADLSAALGDQPENGAGQDGFARCQIRRRTP